MTFSGLLPSHPFHLFYPLFVVLIWTTFLKQARERNILIFYNSSLAVSFWEEVLFRGLVLGLLLNYVSTVSAIIVSSLLFGFFHVRNFWWAEGKRVVWMCIYAGLFVGPILGWVRVVTGDIYLGILLHFLNNFFIMFPLPFMKKFAREVPSDAFLASKRKIKV